LFATGFTNFTMLPRKFTYYSK